LFFVIFSLKADDLPVDVIIHEGVDLHDEDDNIEGVKQP
jgi:hypothetical protein